MTSDAPNVDPTAGPPVREVFGRVDAELRELTRRVRRSGRSVPEALVTDVYQALDLLEDVLRDVMNE